MKKLWLFANNFEKKNLCVGKLNEAFMVSKKWPFIAKLIQEIFYFKSWVQGYLKDGFEI
jgi:hypothetical protein